MKNNRLVIISHRLPFSFTTENKTTTLKPSAGGLVTAVKSLELSSFAEKPLWIGCADFTQRTWDKHHGLVDDSFVYLPVFIDKRTHKKFYNGFSNSVLWPLFHYFSTYVDYHDDDFKAYRLANEQVAEKVAEALQPNDLVWVHDYHFIPLPQLIRERQPEAQIGFFLHIPFPSFELLRLLPKSCRNYLLRGLLGANLVGFHTSDYRLHFLQSVQMALGLPTTFGQIVCGERMVDSGVFPIGINYSLFHDAYHQEDVEQERQQLRTSYAGRMIFSVDRLDYTKGVMQRLDALEAFLTLHPEWKEQIVFLLVVIPSRDEIQSYWERKQMIEQAVGRINGQFATLTWLPVVYRYAPLSFPQLMGLYTACDVAMITPVRDGMNLVAKEFIASRSDQQGVLVLSELTGAANELGEALRVNPLDEFEVADALKQALEMSPDEQTRRMEAMQQRISQYDVKKWASDFIEVLVTTPPAEHTGTGALLEGKIKKNVLKDFARARSRLLLLDYDGTLAEFTSEPGLAAPSAGVLETLRKLASQPENKVVIISGRDQPTLESWFGSLPIDLVAEHGDKQKQNGSWQKNNQDNAAWKNRVRPLLDEMVNRCRGSFIEEKATTLVWHYRNANEEIGFERSRELLLTLTHLLPHTLRIIDGNKVIEIKSVDWDKGKLARRLIDGSRYDFVLAVGDDQTDEDMLAVLTQEHQYPVKVGHGPTAATYRLPDVQQVVNLLDSFVQPAKPVRVG
ncbi:bifunctional alpha,alpha-trehalose-phosphate synthase (UDP-forming)/trehalose-phosphatase [Larkinella knui]|uniref:Bifunctional alpha,alpha-trehalose-phosphate synthase (UDP-forming)/trehalose-phosphatase n=1 Tax=Larkinella knui TaxID=2025310 RepID=A0A3P1CXF7_9BACT|nr:bifunctional alpha,alpha-trehalose-phosphate synthase (UDP-forming)/trehalose-phosphatase [Larkinella knui]RRB18102.1 bifunctional alpha,alpha-trehalose-phosphate synthase (UDP-forming)/trehalose-phosphatase [Larkinella knui]